MDAVTPLTEANEAALLAEATPDAVAVAGRPSGPLARLQALPVRKQWLLGAGTAGLLALLVVLALWTRQVPMVSLFGHSLPEAEAGTVVDQLGKMGESYELSPLGQRIMVPASRVNELRMRLATLGLPKSAPSGYELFDKQNFGRPRIRCV